ncbi:hypothetical protein PCASD_26583 [Puccinia coronata f. sp. avenae]|uniref:Uncharacterized protein n=1 Tax=Puccinia coronata f. sp. avenae TaxID=200324 RepID=A0A2N5TID9_9BASI|nr:hypothetical protein PCASD_26583 [Puccinia coronata f. sp. avenae]
MPSHLRNGKDLLFEQRRTAKRAAARDAGRIRQQQQLADLASHSSAPELPLPSAFHSYHKLPNANGPASSIRQSSANNGLSAPGSAIDHPSVLGDQPAAGYTLSPAALEKIRRSREQQQVAGATSSINLSRAIELRPTSDLCATGLSDPASHRSATGGYPPVGYSLSSDALERLCRTREPQSDAQKLGQDGPLNSQPSGSPRPREIHGHSHTSSGRVHDYLKHPSGPVVPVYQRSAERQHASHENSPSPSGLYPANPSKHVRDPLYDAGVRWMDSQRRTSLTREIHTSSDQAPPDPSASCASTATPTSTCAAAEALTRANDSPAFTNGHTTRYWTPSRFPDPTSNSSGTAPCPVATSTPIQPSPLCPAPTAKWKPVQPPLPKEQTPEVQKWPQQP